MSLTAERLRHLLSYDPESGLFTWKNPQSNRVNVGQVAGTVSGNSNGYVQISIDGKLYHSHRLAWLYMTGEWPADQIDHANRNRSDNRWSNLRAATRSQNAMNSFHANNTSGRKGVNWHKKTGKWVAKISVDCKTHHLGYYNDIEDAAVAYKNIARILHGKFNNFGD